MLDGGCAKGKADESGGAATLQLAFARFSEAGSRLEKRYSELSRETEELRRRLKEKDAEIERSAKLAMLGETAAAIAHEVRNPLGAIRLFTSLLRQDLRERPESLQLVDEIEKSLTVLDHSVENILQFARKQKPSFAPLNLHALIQEQSDLLLRAQKSELRIELELGANPYIRGNEHALRQVFYNLFLNAAQAMHWNGCIRIKSADQAPGSVSICIHDSGPGIAESVRTRLFEPFVTTRSEGTGLGLAIVRQILESHGEQ